MLHNHQNGSYLDELFCAKTSHTTEMQWYCQIFPQVEPSRYQQWFSTDFDCRHWHLLSSLGSASKMFQMQLQSLTQQWLGKQPEELHPVLVWLSWEIYSHKVNRKELQWVDQYRFGYKLQEKILYSECMALWYSHVR